METSGQNLNQNRQGEIRGTMIAIVVLATFFVGLRFYARWVKGVRYGWDDWMILFALPWLFILLALGLMMVHFGLGTHQDGLTIPQLIDFGKSLLAFECIYILTAGIIKTSLLLMYVRAFDIRSLRIASVILEVIVIAWAIAIIVLCIFQCTPVAKAWNPSIPGTCINLKGNFIGNAVPNIVTDVLILALPIHALWKLDTTTGLKIQLSIVFLLGSFVVFTAIYRFSTLFRFNQRDTTWTLATSCAWVVVEVSSGVISVCLPTLSPLLQFASCLPSRRLTQKSGSGGSRGTTSSGKMGSLPTRVYAIEENERDGMGGERNFNGTSGLSNGIGGGSNGRFERLNSHGSNEGLAEETLEAQQGTTIRRETGEEVDRFGLGKLSEDCEGDTVQMDEFAMGRGRRMHVSDEEWGGQAYGLAPPPRNSMVKKY